MTPTKFTANAITLTNVNKMYEIHHEKPTLVEKFVTGKNEAFWALRNINLTIKKGEHVGVVGLNGSGKTTLLKIIAGITTPTHGSVKTDGKLVSLIDLEAGFHHDLPGYQNIYLNGMLLGLAKKRIDRLLPSIVSYAGLKQFIDAPLYTYSAGMKLRLGFAVAIHADPNILVLDEGLGVGDIRFREKAKRTLLAQYRGKKTILISAHNTEIITQQCNRVIILNQGIITHDGGLEVLKRYEKNKR